MHGSVQATMMRMHPATSPWGACCRIDHDGGHRRGVILHQAYQFRPEAPLPATHTCACRCVARGQVYYSAGVSGRMSIFHPVRRAARRAFCPSLPIAKDSW